jgi:hypothetical protein
LSAKNLSGSGCRKIPEYESVTLPEGKHNCRLFLLQINWKWWQALVLFSTSHTFLLTSVLWTYFLVYVCLMDSRARTRHLSMVFFLQRRRNGGGIPTGQQTEPRKGWLCRGQQQQSHHSNSSAGKVMTATAFSAHSVLPVLF